MSSKSDTANGSIIAGCSQRGPYDSSHCVLRHCTNGPLAGQLSGKCAASTQRLPRCTGLHLAVKQAACTLNYCGKCISHSDNEVGCWLRAQITLPAVDEKKKVIEDVDKDRKYAIDAAIVRTMKSRKVLNHQHVRPPIHPPPIGT